MWTWSSILYQGSIFTVIGAIASIIIMTIIAKHPKTIDLPDPRADFTGLGFLFIVPASVFVGLLVGITATLYTVMGSTIYVYLLSVAFLVILGFFVYRIKQ